MSYFFPCAVCCVSNRQQTAQEKKWLMITQVRINQVTTATEIFSPRVASTSINRTPSKVARKCSPLMSKTSGTVLRELSAYVLFASMNFAMPRYPQHIVQSMIFRCVRDHIWLPSTLKSILDYALIYHGHVGKNIMIIISHKTFFHLKGTFGLHILCLLYGRNTWISLDKKNNIRIRFSGI